MRQVQSSAPTADAPAAVSPEAAIDSAASIGSASASPDSAAPAEAGRLQHMAATPGIDMPAGRCAAGQAGPCASERLSLNSQLPLTIASQSQHSGQAPETIHTSAYEGAMKTEAAVATMAPVQAATFGEPSAALARARQLLDGAAASQFLDSSIMRADMQLHASQAGSEAPVKASRSPVDSGASAAAAAAHTAAAGQSPSLPPRPNTLATYSEHVNAQPAQATRVPGLRAPGLQPHAASRQTGLRDTSDAILQQTAEDAAAKKHEQTRNSTLLPDRIAALPCEQLAKVPHGTEHSSGVQPEPSGLNAQQLESMSQLVAQLGSTPAARHSTSPLQPQQAAPASVDHLLASATSPMPQTSRLVHQPGLPVDPRPARACSLMQTTPQLEPEHERAAAGRTAQPGRPPRSDTRPQHFFSATRPLPGPGHAPGPETVSAPVRASGSMQERQPSPQQDGDSPRDRAAAGLSRPHAVLSGGVEVDLDTGARPKAMTGPNTRPWRTPIHVRLPTASRRIAAARPAADGGSSGPSPPADGAPRVPASLPAAAAANRSSSPQTMPSKHQQEAPASPASVPLAHSTGSPPPGSVTATAAGLTPAAESAPAPHAAVDPAAATLAAWLHGLPSEVRKELAAVEHLVLPRKKLKLLKDVDTHLYSASKSAVCLSQNNVDTSHPCTMRLYIDIVHRYCMHNTPTICCVYAVLSALTDATLYDTPVN